MDIVLITGGTKGIGKALTKKYLSEGCFVISIYANDDLTADKLRAEINVKYCNMYEFIKINLSTIDNVESLCNYIIKKYKKIDHVIINAGVTNKKSWNSITIEEWNYVINVNLTMPFFVIQKLSSHISYGGNIIFIGAVMGIYPHAISVPYAVSKAGLHMLSKSLVKYFADKKVTVNTVAPGFVETPWQGDKPLEQKQRIQSKTALKRFAYPDEIADLCWDVCKNKFINGSIVKIDGGYCFE